MSEREQRFRTAATIYFPMVIAVLSLVTSIYNGYLNNKFVNIAQGNLSRGEYLHTCKEIIGAYFQVKFRVGLQVEAGANATNAAALRADASGAVSHFSGLGTYLANLRNDEIRARYTRLSWALSDIVNAAAQSQASPSTDLNKLFAPADAIFADMNDDCVRSANAQALKN